MMYIISQIFILINYIFLILTYQIKSGKKILLYSTIGCFSSAIGFFFLNAYSGCVMALIAVLRNLLFMTNNNRKVSLFITIFLILIVSIYTYQCVFSILPVIATLLYSISLYDKECKLYRIYGIPIEICWLLYHIYLFSVVGITFETILFISVLIGVIKSKSRKQTNV